MANISITFDGVDVSQYFATWQETENSRLNLVSVPRRHGAIVSDAITQDARQITIEGRIQETDAVTARTTLDTLSELFSRTNRKLTLWDDRAINAYKAQFGWTYADGGAMCVIDFQLIFFCADPFWYSNTPTAQGQQFISNLNTTDILIDFTNNLYKISPTSIAVNGTFIAYPVWTVYATSIPLKFITIRNLSIGRQFTYTGTVLVGTSVIIDTANFTVMNNGVSDLTNWTGDWVWLDPSVPGGNNSIQFEGTAPAAYSWTYTPRTF